MSGPVECCRAVQFPEIQSESLPTALFFLLQVDRLVKRLLAPWPSSVKGIENRSGNVMVTVGRPHLEYFVQLLDIGKMPKLEKKVQRCTRILPWPEL